LLTLRFIFCTDSRRNLVFMMKIYAPFLILLVFANACDSGNDMEQMMPSIRILDAERLEGDEGILNLDYTIALSEAHSEDIILKYKTDDASAFQNVDYKKAEGQLTIPAGSTQGTITLEIISDIIKEGNEFFRLQFESDQGVQFSSSNAIIRIKNDDSELPYEAEDYTTPTSYEGWATAWADEFNGATINKDWWTHEIGNGDNGWGNNEMEYYTDARENSRIVNGNLVIEARDDSWNGHKYTSARMVTRDKKVFSSGRTDIRAKLPYGQGIWPALWMLGRSIDLKGWPACGEIDIMELIGNLPSTSHATVHFGSSSSYKYIGDSYKITGEKFNDRFHVFSVVRELNQMWFYVDDILIFDFTSKDTQGQPYPFNEQFFFIFNVAIGGTWPGSPDASTIFPQKMEVDYIRVFKKE
jgi:beta-glucanase (GH16 family)